MGKTHQKGQSATLTPPPPKKNYIYIYILRTVLTFYLQTKNTVIRRNQGGIMRIHVLHKSSSVPPSLSLLTCKERKYVNRVLDLILPDELSLPCSFLRAVQLGNVLERDFLLSCFPCCFRQVELFSLLMTLLPFSTNKGSSKIYCFNQYIWYSWNPSENKMYGD